MSNPILITEQRLGRSVIGYAEPTEAAEIAVARSEAALLAELGSAGWDRLRGRFTRERELELGRVVHGLAAHLPAFGPAIHARSTHILNEAVEGGCCELPPMVR